jgi:hypothetical protein
MNRAFEQALDRLRPSKNPDILSMVSLETTRVRP